MQVMTMDANWLKDELSEKASEFIECSQAETFIENRVVVQQKI